MEELKRCPFCGGRGARVDVTYEFSMLHPVGKNKHFYIIECFDCEARTKPYSNIDLAIEAWNRENKAGWIKMSDPDRIYYCCSRCGEEGERTKFCPNCGAKMEVSTKE